MIWEEVKLRVAVGEKIPHVEGRAFASLIK